MGKPLYQVWGSIARTQDITLREVFLLSRFLVTIGINLGKKHGCL